MNEMFRTDKIIFTEPELKKAFDNFVDAYRNYKKISRETFLNVEEVSLEDSQKFTAALDEHNQAEKIFFDKLGEGDHNEEN